MNFRKKLLYTILTTPFGVLTCKAYIWQSRRKLEKIEEMKDRELSLSRPPIIINSELLKNFEMTKDKEFTPVKMTGYFDNKKLLINKTKDTETGFNIVSPFYCYKDSNGIDQPLIIDRGWIPYDYLDKFKSECKDGRLQVLNGIIYSGDKQNKFTKTADEDIEQAQNKLFYMIPQELSHYLGIRNQYSDKFIIKLTDFSGKQEFPKLVNKKDLMVWYITPQTHQNYAYFWIIATVLNICSNLYIWKFL